MKHILGHGKYFWYEKIFLDLQQDEIEFANKEFRDLYNILMTEYQINGFVSIEKIVPSLSTKLSEIVSSIILQEEKHFLHKWDKKSIYVKEKKYFSRIRVEDLAQIIKKMFYSQQSSLILNASDDKPATNIEVANFAAKLLKIKNLKPMPISNFKNKMIKEFYKDSKKVSNKKMKNKLLIKLKYPTYKEGLRNIFNNSR